MKIICKFLPAALLVAAIIVVTGCETVQPPAPPAPPGLPQLPPPPPIPVP